MEGNKTPVHGTENIFNKIIEGNVPNLKKELPSKVQEAYRTLNTQNQKGNSKLCLIIKTLQVQNLKRILKVAKEKDYLTGRHPTKITFDYSMGNLKARRPG